MFADVAFPISGFQTFTYKIPKDLVSEVQIGSRVTVQFGPRKTQGIVTGLKNESSFSGKIKDIAGLVDNLPIMTPELWKLIQWMSQYYVTPLGQVGKAVLPKNLSTRYNPPKSWMVQAKPIFDDEDLEAVKKRAPKQYEVYQKIWKVKKPIQVSSLKDLASNPLNVCRGLEKRKLVTLFEETSLPDITGFTFDPIHKKVSFNSHQQVAVDAICKSLDKKEYSPFLLHGVTGSGKTEIYVEGVRHCLAQKRTAIILLPEISLTPQIAGRFRAVFGDTIALWHSKLTQAQRSWTWKEICKGTFKVVIGARSAVFAPLKHLGLIVIDEEQESSFRQDSPAPRYHARDVALMRATYEGASVVLSSATPSLESYYNYLHKKLSYLHLPERYGGAKYPHVHLVDMLSDQEESGKYGQIFSGLLQDKIEDRLNKKEQIILLQNRRGYSPVIRCGDCGEIVMCPQCKVALTFHSKGSQLICHFCGHIEIKQRETCIHCRCSNMKYSGTGTQRVESILEETFPQARVARLDMDTAGTSQGLISILKAFANGEIDILLGTQMIAKGLDFPNATLVGIINADLGLHLPDFRSGERIFQLIYQASGRAGRRKIPGEVVIQTYVPDNPVIKNAAKLDMIKYYNIALSERNELKYPPFSWMAKIEITGENQIAVDSLSERISKLLNGKYKGLDVLGPAPCYLEKLRNQYRFQIVFKSLKSIDPNGYRLHKFIQDNFMDIQKKYRPGKNRINIHFDPLSLI
ncbi:MAG: primosomal protein N' [Candidatus Marinimicrobia bacterium]|jgi:primosomal protein N' (replication factor Y)|nr:primosomal protein N' [Candidatus Neomarinimicrobiota bacterium]MBT3838417.1 primosomal protein N' [Candidatus Neomarinimicrobiota bacterium]MBT3998722.1 primosomal protein N' [Candidatus Neomarinimicrobiota bacterium]MBT4283301.1 primosomal protein N' [Candidatus Neomarinimicrobiota bacterium]MBT4578386.1 primosomal protein N' [Candidatus Neomarinimicrobiota bacterium]